MPTLCPDGMLHRASVGRRNIELCNPDARARENAIQRV